MTIERGSTAGRTPWSFRSILTRVHGAVDFPRHDGNIRSASHGVFDDLGNLRRGDRIVIRAMTGRAAYTVTETDEVAR